MTAIKHQGGKSRAKDQAGGRSGAKQQEQSGDRPQAIQDEQLDPVSGAGYGTGYRCR